MIYQDQNFSGIDPQCQDGDVFIHCNLSQLVPYTKICVGKQNLVLERCNLVNCVFPEGTKLDAEPAQIRYWTDENGISQSEPVA